MMTAEQLDVHREALVGHGFRMLGSAAGRRRRAGDAGAGVAAAGWELGFSFNPRFTDAKAACMVVSDLGYVYNVMNPDKLRAVRLGDTRPHRLSQPRRPGRLVVGSQA